MERQAVHTPYRMSLGAGRIMANPLLTVHEAEGAETGASGLELRLFGPMQVRLGPQPLPRLRSRKGLWVLALLALRGGRDVERAWLAGVVWADYAEADGRRSLRQSLHDLRRALGPEAWRLSCESSRTLRLELSGAFVDVLAFDAAVAGGEDPEGMHCLEAAVQLYRGPLLEDCAVEWILQERSRREQDYLAALQRLASAAAARGDHSRAVSLLRLAVIAEPYREDLRRDLMEALTEGGNPAGALLVYREFRDLLWREMTAEPSVEMTALFQRLREETRRRARPPAPAPAPAPCSTDNLPRPLSAFIGRARDLEEVRARLAGARLVTLTGPGGIGKTRLAIRAAEECAPEYADGVRFVDLAPLAGAALVPQAVARAMQVQEAPDRSLTEALQEALGARQFLVVLDNCEHLLDACAQLSEALLSSCPHLQVLATSRQPLGLAGEVAWPVAPLSLPGNGRQTGDAAAPPPGDLLDFEAVRLFVERGSTATPDFALTAENGTAIVQVCRRLDGIPLALELAAARLKVLSVEQIAARLDDRFQLLTGGSRTALPRQQTLRATLDWSYHLLSEPERILLSRLSVFSGGFMLEAAEAVCRMTNDECRITDEAWASPLPFVIDHSSFPPEVLDLLTQLVDRSLVGVERREGTTRYGLLETTREYARERLRAAGEEEAYRVRHARFFLALAERAEPELTGAQQAVWLRRLEEEHDNIRVALDTFLALELPEDGLRLAGALGWFWGIRGYLSEGRERLQAALALSGCRVVTPGSGREARVGGPPECHPELRSPGIGLAQVKALNAAGRLADDQSDAGAARAMFQESLALSRALGDQTGAAMALNCLGGLAVHARDYPAARALYEESLATYQSIEDRWGAAAALTNLGRTALVSGDYAAARAVLQSALETQRQLGDRRAIARTLTWLGITTQRLGNPETAYALHQESLSLARELGAKQAIEETLRGLGSLASDLGRQDAALAYYEERLAIARETGSAWGSAESLYALGRLARDRGDSRKARSLWSESLAISCRLEEGEFIAQCLEGFASLACPAGSEAQGAESPSALGPQPEEAAQRAARLFGAAAALRERAGAPIAQWLQAGYEREVGAAGAILPPAEFDAAWEEGRAMPLDQAIESALAEDPDR